MSLPDDLMDILLMPFSSSDDLGSQIGQMRNDDSSLFPSYNHTNEIYGATAATNSMSYDSLATVQQRNLLDNQVNWNSGDSIHGTTGITNYFPPNQHNVLDIKSNSLNNSSFSNQEQSDPHQPYLDQFPHCSYNRQINHPVGASSCSSGTESSSLEVPDLNPSTMPMQIAGQERDILPREDYNKMTPGEKLSRQRELSVKRSTKYNAKKKKQRESLGIQAAEEEYRNQALKQEYRQKLKQCDIMEKAVIKLKRRNANFSKIL